MGGWGTSAWGAEDAGAGGAGPQIANVSPPAGEMPGSYAQAVNTPIEFDVTDATPDLLGVEIWLKYDDDAESVVVHDGTQFCAPFNSGTSARTVIANGYHFTVLPIGGWRGAMTWEVRAYDSSGNKI